MKLINQIDLEKSFINHVVQKYRSYALIDIENKMYQLTSIKNTEPFDEAYFAELTDLRLYYEKASIEELAIDLLDSAANRYNEEPMSYAKEAFDLILSKKKFSSYH